MAIPAAPWKFEAGNGTCTMHQQVEGRRQEPFIDVRLTWHGIAGNGADVRMARVFGRDSVIRLQSRNSPESWSRPTDGSGPIATSKAAVILRKNLLRGLPILVSIEGGKDRPMRYATSLEGAEAASAAFEDCIRDERKRVAGEDRAPRWTGSVDIRGRCSLRQPFIGAEGLSAYFRDSASSELQLQMLALDSFFPKGGVLRVFLPGQSVPWMIDSEKATEAGPRVLALLGEIRAGKVPRMEFEARGAPPVPLTATGAGMAEAVAMFDACNVASTRPRPEVVPLNELQYSLEESAAGCRLSAAYQIESAVIWLAAIADGEGYRVSVTKRIQRNGLKIASLDLHSLGGAAQVEQDDLVIPASDVDFSALVKKAMGEGHEVGLLVTPTQGFTVRFGGPQAISETAMFDACVRAKYPALRENS